MFVKSKKSAILMAYAFVIPAVVIALGVSFVVQGLSAVLPNNLSSIIAPLLSALVGGMIIVMTGITVATWKIK